MSWLRARGDRTWQVVAICFVSWMATGCALNPQETRARDEARPKDIFVFFEGTRNGESSETNVGRLRELVLNNQPAQYNVATIWIAGVGVGRYPLTGALLGKGMSTRIRAAYAFISKHHREGDRIFIFGFSRGAHQARSLAGMISYDGLLVADGMSDRQLRGAAKKVLKYTQRITDRREVSGWKDWDFDDPPPLTARLKADLGLETHKAWIQFVGVWDTVPGSSLKKYSACKEEENESVGDRYKSDSYPPIKVIAHALSLDEMRDKFKPIVICQGKDSVFHDHPPKHFPEIHERWFPGAHSDVGGGLDDQNGLPDISLNWMLGVMKPYRQLEPPPGKVTPNPIGRAHWMINGVADRWAYDCKNREWPEDPAVIDESAKTRKDKALVPLMRGGKEDQLPYPQKCPD
jgi:uncharacterized protein (DUF2235 family)